MKGVTIWRANGLWILSAAWILLLGYRSAEGSNLVLTWSEEFDGTQLGTNWVLDTGNGCDQGENLCGWGNDEKQSYTTVNHEVTEGELVITARLEETPVDERWYTSSRLRTTGSAAFLTGRVEARIDLPKGAGLWGAFWMLPANTSRGVWAATGEIDIMEAVNDMNSVGGTIHYGGEYPSNRFAGCWQDSGIDLSDGYHVYTVDWEQDEMHWFVDGQLYCHRTKWFSDVEESYDSFTAPFDTEFEILLNLAVGGYLPGSDIDSNAFPAEMRVDYVRVYEVPDKEPEPYFGEALCLPGVVQAEAFDTGGRGIAFWDDEANRLVDEGEESLRPEELEVLMEGDRAFVRTMFEGEWVAYTIYAESGDYDITMEVATAQAAALQLVIDADSNCTLASEGGVGNGTSLLGVVAVPPTGGEGVWSLVSFTGVTVPAGLHTLKMCVEGGVGLTVDSITFTLPTAEFVEEDNEVCVTGAKSVPYMFAQPWVIPGYIEAEFFDHGGEGVGFHDTTPADNTGGSTLRSESGVDIYEADSNPSRGNNVGGWDVGEWLMFTARAAVGAYWDVAASVASGSTEENAFKILLNSTDCIGTSLEVEQQGGLDLLGGVVSFNQTGSWEAFEEITTADVWVPAGTHSVVFCSSSSAFRLNYLRFFTPVPTPVPSMSPTPVPTMSPTPTDNLQSSGRGTWTYIVVGSVVAGAVILARLGWIIYARENARRRSVDSGEGGRPKFGHGPPKLPALPSRSRSISGTSGSAGGESFIGGGLGSSTRLGLRARQTDVAGGDGGGESTGGRGEEGRVNNRSVGGLPWEQGSSSIRPKQKEGLGWTGLNLSLWEFSSPVGKGGGSSIMPDVEVVPKEDDAGDCKQSSSQRTIVRSFSLVEGGPFGGMNELGSLSPVATTVEASVVGGRFVQGGFQPLVSPVMSSHSIPVGETMGNTCQAQSPMHSPATTAAASRGRTSGEVIGQYRDRGRGVEWRKSRQQTLNGNASNVPVISRSRSAMLDAGSSWLCRSCTFENSQGQQKCLHCGRCRPQDLFVVSTNRPL